MKKIMIVFASCMLILLAGCSANDKRSLVEWMRALDAQHTNAFFWAQENNFAEIELTSDEKLRLLSLLSELPPKDITWNKHQAGSTPEYGFHLSVGNADYYINQAGAPLGQTEIHFQGKQWWLESAELFELLKSFLKTS